MAYFKHPTTKVYEADIKDRVVGRVHMSLRTKHERVAIRHYAALETAVRQNHPVLALLRRRKRNIQELTTCYEAGKPFDTLLAGANWPTLGDAATDFLAWLEAHPDRSAKTAKNTRSVLDAAIAFLGADTRLDQILVEGDGDAGTKGTQDWHQALSAKGRQDTTVAEYVRRLGALFGWVQRREDQRALQERRVPRVLHAPINWELVPKGRSTRVRFLTPGEALRLLAATPVELRFAFAAALLGGFRIDEVAHFARADVDRTLGWLYVQAKPAPWLPKGEWRPKAKSAREVPIHTQLLPLLDTQEAEHAGERWLTPSFEYADRPIHARTLDHWLRRIAPSAGLAVGLKAPDGITFHTLRHTFASWLVMEGVDLLTVARLLGHTTTKQVERTYAHLSPEHRAQAVARLGNRFTLALPETSPSEVTP